MKVKLPLVSIIIPIYNVGPFLYQCIDSVVNQSYKNLQIILVNDGSLDYAKQICECFTSDSRVVLINKNNGGLVAARKTGLQCAAGAYILNLDGDDWLSKEYIEHMVVYALDGDADIVLPSHYREFLGKVERIDNKVSYGFYDGVKLQNLKNNMLSYESKLCPGIYSYSWGKLFKKKSLYKYQMSVPDILIMGEDAAVVYPAIYNSDSVHVVDYAGYYYRQRQTSILKSIESPNNEIPKILLLYETLLRGLSESNSLNIKKEQLRSYLFGVLAVRTAGFWGLGIEGVSVDLLFPKNLNLGIYSSGSFGQALFRKFTSEHGPGIIRWFDEDYLESRLIGLPVYSLEDFSQFDIDVIFVATVDSVIGNRVKTKLINAGVSDNKIFLYQINHSIVNVALNKLGL